MEEILVKYIKEKLHDEQSINIQRAVKEIKEEPSRADYVINDLVYNTVSDVLETLMSYN